MLGLGTQPGNRPSLSEAVLLHTNMKVCLERIAEASACAIRAGAPQHCGGIIVADIAAPDMNQSHGSFDPFCRPAERGGKAASKTLVTDYMFAGPGCATHKLVGRGHPWTPPAPAGAAA